MRGKKKQKITPNFLTCPAAPELVSGSEGASLPAKASKQRPRSKNGRSAPANDVPRVPAQSPLKKVIPPIKDEPKEKPLRKKRNVSLWIIIALIVVAAAVTGPAVFALARTGASALAAKSSVEHMVDAMKERDIDTASEELESAYGHLVDAHDAVKGVGFWRDVPTVGTQLRALEDATAAGAETLDGIRGVFVIAADLMDIASEAGALVGGVGVEIEEGKSFEDLTMEEKRDIFGRLYRALPEMRIAQAKIDVALETWNRIPQNELIAPLRNAFQPIAEGLPILKRSMDEAIPLMEVFIPLAGYPEPSNWVVLLQNTDEIRATGGFIGTVGTLQMDSGEINKDTFKFVDVYNIDFPAADRGWSEVPPLPIKERMGVQNLYLRDANWSPDFPTSAATMLDFYVREIELGTGVRPSAPSGIIAINPPLFEELMGIVGPITVSDGVEDITFKAGSFFDVLEYEVEVGFLKKGIPRLNRKDLVQKVGNELLAKLMKLPASKWPDMLDVLTKRFERDQVIIYATDPDLMARLDAFGWTGRTLPTDGDYLMVIDSNLAALKTDAVVDKDVTYALDARDPNNVTATVTLSYSNNAPGLADPNDPLNYKYTRYRSYTRIYVPEGAELISSSGAMADDRYRTGGVFRAGRTDVMRELGKTVFGAFWSIEPQTTQELSFTYRLPAPVAEQIRNNTYRLDWQKQSGNDEATLTLDLAFGKDLMSASPPEGELEWGDTAYRMSTDSMLDRSFEVKL